MRSWFEARIHPIGVTRRFMLAITGIAVTGVVFHSWIALSLVGRGDDLIRAGNPKRAIIYFERAARFDPAWQVPVERFGFGVTLLGNRAWYASEIRVATGYLERHPEATKIRWDRAVAYLHLQDDDAAYRDLALIVRQTPQDHEMRDVADRLAARIGVRP